MKEGGIDGESYSFKLLVFYNILNSILQLNMFWQSVHIIVVFLETEAVIVASVVDSATLAQIKSLCMVASNPDFPRSFFFAAIFSTTAKKKKPACKA